MRSRAKGGTRPWTAASLKLEIASALASEAAERRASRCLAAVIRISLT